MGWLKDTIDSFVANYISNFFWNTKWATKQALKSCETTACADKIWGGLDAERREDPEIAALYEDAKARGEQNKELGTFGGLPVALYEGLKDLTEDMSDAAGGAISEMYTDLFASLTGQPLSSEAEKKLSGTSVPEAVGGIVDSIVDVVLLPFDKGAEALDKEIPGTAKTAIREMVKLGAGLGATVGLGGYIMEHFHPTKSTNAARSLNMILELVGFRTLRDAYLKPLRWQLIELPLRYKWNSLIHAGIPTQGEITGLARKYEITPDEYRKAMHMQGVDDFWIDKLLMGFWADPRLFEIIRLMEVERPPEKPPEEAVTWLKAAKLDRFIGPDWWLAMKFGKAGYDQIDIPVLVSAVKARNVQRELGDIRALQRKLYRDGTYSREHYETLLAARGISKEEMKELIDAIDEELVDLENREYRRAYERKYLTGRITIEELEKLLVKYGLREDRAKARTAYMIARKEGKLAVEEEEEKDLTVTQILRAWKLRMKDKGWALKRIDDKGYTTEDAVTLVDTEEQDHIDDVNAEWIRTYEQRTRYGRMIPAELEKKLVEHGKDPEWAKARAAYFEEIVLGKEEAA